MGPTVTEPARTEELDDPIVDEEHPKLQRQKDLKKLSLQKRFLVSPEEDQRIERQLLTLKTKAGISVSYSCLVRSFLHMYLKHKKEILQAASNCELPPRPPNSDRRKQEEYERFMAEIITQGIRQKKPNDRKNELGG